MFPTVKDSRKEGRTTEHVREYEISTRSQTDTNNVREYSTVCTYVAGGAADALFVGKLKLLDEYVFVASLQVLLEEALYSPAWFALQQGQESLATVTSVSYTHLRAHET